MLIYNSLDHGFPVSLYKLSVTRLEPIWQSQINQLEGSVKDLFVLDLSWAFDIKSQSTINISSVGLEGEIIIHMIRTDY